jgi:hypothetical protein
MKFIDFLSRLFPKKQQPPASSSAEISGENPEMMRKILEMLSNTQEIEFTCDDVFSILDQAAELAARGENLKDLMPLVQNHIDICSDCREEYEALQRVLMNTA